MGDIEAVASKATSPDVFSVRSARLRVWFGVLVSQRERGKIERGEDQKKI